MSDEDGIPEADRHFYKRVSSKHILYEASDRNVRCFLYACGSDASGGLNSNSKSRESYHEETVAGFSKKGYTETVFLWYYIQRS